MQDKYISHSNTIGSPVILEVNGYLLRSLTESDITEEFAQWLSAPEMMRGLNLGNVHYDLAQLKAFTRTFDNRNNYFIGIFDRKNNDLLIGFYTIDVNSTHKLGNITVGLGYPEYSGREVLWGVNDALLHHFYKHRGVEKMAARVLYANKKMLFCFLGNPVFALEAVLKKECLASDGSKRLDVLVFSSFKDNFIWPVD